MPEYKVCRNLKRDGVIYSPGDTITLPKKEADKISAGVLKEIKKRPVRKTSKKAVPPKAEPEDELPVEKPPVKKAAKARPTKPATSGRGGMKK
jgi:hypothetical protein